MRKVPLTSNQRRGFLAAWGGWVLDGMDSFIYALVMVPALRQLLPRSGIPADQSHIGFYGGLLFALFLVGWGCSLVWGPIADRFGRVHTLMLTILCYSIFTFLGAFATSVWMLIAPSGTRFCAKSATASSSGMRRIPDAKPCFWPVSVASPRPAKLRGNRKLI